MTYRQSWSARIQLEAACHAYSAFVTLTYSPESLPDPPQLQPEDLQKFLKRLRRRLEPRRIRFFACGEYGSRSLRPHYHLVLFGVEANLELERIVNESWNYVDRESGIRVNQGFTKVDPLSPARAAYVAKYVCKEVSGDEKIPEGWQKEFARMSNRGGIASSYVDQMAEAINRGNEKQLKAGYPLLTDLVGGSMKIGPFFYPVARYLRVKLKEKVLHKGKSDLAKALASQARSFAEVDTRGVDPEADRRRDVRVKREARRRIRKSQGVL